MSGIQALTLELQPATATPAAPGDYIAYDVYRSARPARWTPERGWRNGDGTPFRHITAFLGPIPERDIRTGELRWPQHNARTKQP